MMLQRPARPRGASRQPPNLSRTLGEFYAEDDFRQLVVTIEATPAFLGGLGELEDHRERSLIRKTSLRAHGAVTHGGERAFDDVGRAQVFPVLGRELVKGQ